MSNEDIPKFETAVAIRPARVPNVQGDFAALGSVFARISRSSLAIGQSLADQKAKLVGAEAGEEPGLKLAPPINETTRAFNRSAIASNKTFNLMNIREEARNIHDNITSAKNFSIEADPINSFKKEYGQFAQDTLQGILPENKIAAQNALNFYGGNALRSIQGKIETLTYNTARYNFQNSYDALNTGSQLSSLHNDREGAGGQVGAALQSINNAEQSGVITPGYGVTLRNQIQNNAHTSQIIGGFNEAISQGVGQKYLDDTIKAKLPSTFQGNDKSRLITQMRGIQETRALVDNVDNETLQNTISDKLNLVQQGIPTNVLNDISTVSSRNSELGARMKAQYEGRLYYATAVNALKYIPIQRRQAFLVAAEEEVAKSSDPNRLQLIRSLQRASKEQQKNLLDDPAGYVQDFPAVQNALTANQIARKAQAEASDPVGPGGSTDPIISDTGQVNIARLILPQINASKIAPLNIDVTQASLNAQKQMGVPDDKLSVLSNTQTAAIVSNLSPLIYSQQLLSVTQLLAQPEYRQHAPLLLKDLQKAGMPEVTGAALSMAADPATRGNLASFKASMDMDAKTYASLKKNIDTANNIETNAMRESVLTDLSDWNNNLRESYNVIPTKMQQNIINSTIKYAYSLMNQNKGMSLEKAAELASQSYVNHNYQYVSGFTKSLRIGRNVDPEQAREAGGQLILNATSKDIKLQIPPAFAQQFPDSPRPEIEKQYKDWIRAQGSPIALPDTTGMILVDANGSPVLTQNGEKFIITNKELANISSSINTQIDTRTELARANLKRLVVGLPLGGLVRAQES